jgi:hypothetical protein
VFEVDEACLVKLGDLSGGSSNDSAVADEAGSLDDDDVVEVRLGIRL